MSIFFFRAVVYSPDSLRGALGLTDTRNGFHGSGILLFALANLLPISAKRVRLSDFVG